MAVKTIEGVWLTPTPITIKVDEESESEEDVFKFVTERGHMQISVKRTKIMIYGTAKMQRHLSLTETETGFTEEGKANIKVDRITWSNGAAWCRPGATLKDKQKQATEKAKKKASKMVEVLMPPAALGVECGGGCCFCQPSSEPAVAEEPQEVSGRILQPEENHAAAPEQETMLQPDDAAPETEVQPTPKTGGFLNAEQVNDVVDRINEVVGVWGISEEKEAGFIRPPVEMMNTKMNEALREFLNPQLVDLISTIMDDDVGPEDKAKIFSDYFHEHFVNPLCETLTRNFADKFGGFDWMKNQLDKVIRMMSEQVTDEILSKAVEQLGDSDAVS